jgi:hypothetical protein
MSNFEDDQEDLQTVAKYLIGRGYVVVLVVGHSRGEHPRAVETEKS